MISWWCNAEAEQHGSIELWLLMLLAGLAARRCDAVHKLLKKKFAEGHADHAWLDEAIATHPVSPLLLCIPPLNNRLVCVDYLDALTLSSATWMVACVIL